MIEMIGNGMALVDGIVFVVERTGGTDPDSQGCAVASGTDRTDRTDAAVPRNGGAGSGTEEREPVDTVDSVDNVDTTRETGGRVWPGTDESAVRKQRKGCVPDSELTPEQLARRLYMREAKRRSRADVPRKNRRIGERSRAEQIRAAGRAYYQRHREEIMAKRRAKEGAA